MMMVVFAWGSLSVFVVEKGVEDFISVEKCLTFGFKTVKVIMLNIYLST